MADLFTAVATTREKPTTDLTTGEGRCPIRAAPNDGLLPARARPTRGKSLARRARARVARQHADMRTRIKILVLSGITAIQWLAAGFAAGVSGEVEVIGGIPPAAAEAKVGKIFRLDSLNRLATRATPGSSSGGGAGSRGVITGSRRASPLADAVKMEKRVAARAGPDRRRSPDVIIANHALNGAAGELILDFLNELGNRGRIR